MKIGHSILLLLCAFCIGFSSCKKDTDPNSAEFKIVTEYLEVKTTTATITGSFDYPGKINSIKVAVGQRHDFTDAHSFLADVHEKEFEVTLTGLTTGTEYRYRYEVDYGASKPYITEAKTFITQSELPTVKTLEVLALDSTTFRVKCEVLADGGSEVTERGIYWNTYGDPTIGDYTLQSAEGGLGLYTIRMEQLALGKKYYVRAYAKNEAGIGWGEEVLDFVTEAPQGMPIEIELSCSPEDGGTAIGGGTYEVGTQCTVIAEANTGYTFVNWTEDGSQVSSNASYTFPVTVSRKLVANFTKQAYIIIAQIDPEDSGTISGTGGFNYGEQCTLTAIAKTGYKFERWTKGGTTVSTDAEYSFTVTATATYVAHFSIKSYSVNVSAHPTNGGTVSGSGTFNYGESHTVHATQAEGFTFTNWTDDGDEVSTDADYTFTVTSNRNLVANFEPQASIEYTINVSANPPVGGLVDGGGTYQQGQQCTVTATANVDYTFTNWTEGDNVVSINASYTFTMNSDRTLVANFTAQPQVPQGAINGQFTINENGNKVYFAKGNLQYNKTTQVWSFMEHQYDMVETQYQNVGENYANQNIVSLFGWGTSGYHDPSDLYNVNYQPWSTSTATVNETYNYYGYGPSTNMPSSNLTGSSAEYDMGVHNSINNTTYQWRMLTDGEWHFVFNERATSSGIRYAKAQVNGVDGVILLPDDWSASYYSLSSTNTTDSFYTSNIITASQWDTLEQHGAVFLPAAGIRDGTSVLEVGFGYYWSASSSYGSNGCSDSACGIYFSGGYLYTWYYYYRYKGQSVRLVSPAE